jgi:hypothetical protein
MMTKYPEIWNALAADFPKDLVRERKVGGGGHARFITARSAMNRLDDVLGFENWEDAYERDPNGSDNIVCKLSIRLPDGQVVTKSDAGAPGNTGDDGDDDKGAFSDAFKRACVKFGIGRFLYGEGVYIAPYPKDSGLRTEDSGLRTEDSGLGTGDSGRNDQALSTLASPQSSVLSPQSFRSPSDRSPSDRSPSPTSTPEHDEAVRISREHAERNRRLKAPAAPGTPPRTGRQLFAWSKGLEDQFGVGMIKYLETWGERQGFEGRIVNWTEAQVKLAAAQGLRKLEGAVPARLREQAEAH